MIDFDVIENFVSQFKIKKFNFQDKLSLKQELKFLTKRRYARIMRIACVSKSQISMTTVMKMKMSLSK